MARGNRMPAWPALVLAFWTAEVAAGQDLTGTWQATLQGQSQGQRLVLRISGPARGGPRATFYSIDRSGQGLAASITLDHWWVTVSVPGIGAVYRGKLEASGAVLSGAWNQGDGSQPLEWKRASKGTEWPIPTIPSTRAMPATAAPEFDVASIKPARVGASGKAIGIRGREFVTANTSLQELMTWAYGVNGRQILRGPAWTESDKFNVVAKSPDGGQPNEKQWKGMLQKFLAERFRLVFHRDRKELAVYAIIPGKKEVALMRSEGNQAGLSGAFLRQPGIVVCHNAALADLAFLLQTTALDRPVVDRTGLSGRFDFTLRWTPDEFQFDGMGARFQPPSGDGNALPDLATAMEEQLGLKLISTKAPVEVLVIDHVEKPSAN